MRFIPVTFNLRLHTKCHVSVQECNTKALNTSYTNMKCNTVTDQIHGILAYHAYHRHNSMCAHMYLTHRNA
jgi:hypothetical protein